MKDLSKHQMLNMSLFCGFQVLHSAGLPDPRPPPTARGREAEGKGPRRQEGWRRQGRPRRPRPGSRPWRSRRTWRPRPGRRWRRRRPWWTQTLTTKVTSSSLSLNSTVLHTQAFSSSFSKARLSPVYLVYIFQGYFLDISAQKLKVQEFFTTHLKNSATQDKSF